VYERLNRLAPTSAAAGELERSTGSPAHDASEPTARRLTNRKIKSAASASQLAELIAAEAGCFDSVNVSHALSRLAKAAQASSGAAGARALRSSVLLPSAQLLLAQLPRVVGDFDAWDATLSLWSLGWLRLQDAAAIRALCRRARALVATFRPADCAMAVAGFARLGTADTQLLQVVPHVLMAQLDKASPSDIHTLMWGFARLAPGQSAAAGGALRALVRACTEQAAWNADAYTPGQLAGVLWAAAKLRHAPCVELLRIAEARMMKAAAGRTTLGTQDIANTLWAFARFGYHSPELLRALEPRLSRSLGSFRPCELSCVLYAYGHARVFSRVLLDAAAPVLLLRSSRLSHQDLVVALWAYGVFGYAPSSGAVDVTAAAVYLLPTQTAERRSGGVAGVAAAGTASSGAPDEAEEAASAAGSGALAATPHAVSEAGGQHACELETSGKVHAAPEPSTVQLDDDERHNGLRQEGDMDVKVARNGPNVMFLDVLLSLAHHRLPHMRPIGLANVSKALANLSGNALGAWSSSVGGGAASPARAAALAEDLASLAAQRMSEFRPEEIANLLYGISVLRCHDMTVYQACVSRLVTLLEEVPTSSGNVRQLDYRVLNSVVHSCVSAGYMPWDLIELAEIRGFRLRGDPSSLAPRCRLGRAPRWPRWSASMDDVSMEGMHDGVQSSSSSGGSQLGDEPTWATVSNSVGEFPPKPPSQADERVGVVLGGGVNEGVALDAAGTHAHEG